MKSSLHHWQKNLLRSIGIVLVSVSCAILARKLFLGALGTRIVWVTFYPAVMLAALYGGWPAGIATAFSACLIAHEGWQLMADRPFITDFGDRLGMSAFLFNCMLITIAVEMARRARAKAIESQRQAEAANKAKSLFLANMSHELRTPMNAILGFAQILEGDATPAQRENLHIILKSGKHLLSLINDVLSLSKIESGKIVLEPEELALGDLINELILLLKFQAETKGISLALDPTSSFPDFVRTDSSKLRQIILNLTGNAIKFTQQGHVVIKLSSVALSNDTGKLIFEISDTGYGIAPADLERIFLPFEQVTVSGRPLTEGTGLGLAITREYIRLLGGDISVTSELGKGSTFRFSVTCESVPDDHIPKIQKSKGRISAIDNADTCKILIVEDQLENRLLLRQLLTPFGFLLREASDGQEGLSAASAWSPDLILMDRRMPVMDGLEATCQIRMLAQVPKPAIIAVSAHAFREEQQEMMAAGCDAFLRKPFQASELFDILEQHLNIHLRYEPTLTQEPGQENPPLAPELLADLPDELFDALESAIKNLDIATVDATVDIIATQNPALASALRRETGQLAYSEVQRTLEHAKSAGCTK